MLNYFDRKISKTDQILLELEKELGKGLLQAENGGAKWFLVWRHLQSVSRERKWRTRAAKVQAGLVHVETLCEWPRDTPRFPGRDADSTKCRSSFHPVGKNMSSKGLQTWQTPGNPKWRGLRISDLDKRVQWQPDESELDLAMVSSIGLSVSLIAMHDIA